MDLETFARDISLVAVRLAAFDVFGMLTRRVPLPVGCAALLHRDDGTTSVESPGATVDGRGVRELVVVRATPMRLAFDPVAVESSDGHECSAMIGLAVQVVPERADLDAFCNTILGSSRRAGVNRLTMHLRDAVYRAAHEFAAARPAEALVHSRDDDAFSRHLSTALKPVTFAAGLSLAGQITLEVFSEAFEAARRAERHAAEQQRRLGLRQQLQEAEQAARRKHVEELSAMLDRLDALARQRPGVDTARLIQTFDVAERGELYRQLLTREVSARRTAVVAVVAGNELLLFDPNDGSLASRRALEGAPGPLRSVRLMHNGIDEFLVGAMHGVYRVARNGGPVTAYEFDPPGGRVRGGVNAAVLLHGQLFASHSEVGVIQWDVDAPNAPRIILNEQTSGASAVRDIQADEEETLWFTAGERVIGWSPRRSDAVYSAALPDAAGGATADAPATLAPGVTQQIGTLVSIGSILASGSSGGAPRVAALCVANRQVFAGTSDGRLVTWPCRDPSAHQTLLTGEGKVESVQWMSGAGVDRLLVASGRPHLWLLVLGDAYRGEYRAADPLRWAAAADDWIIAVNELRDRLLVWRPWRPEAPERTIFVGRQVGHSIQDAILVERGD